MSTILAAEKISEIRGIDGYSIFDERGILLESSLPEKVINSEMGESLKDLLTKTNNNLGSDGMKSSVLLTAKGAWSITKLKVGYLLLLAGCREPVDIPELTKIAATIKSEIDMDD